MASAVRDIRLAHGPEALPELELHALFAAEEKRVAEAAILTELLVPRLVEALPAAAVAVREVSRPAPRIASAEMRAVPSVSSVSPAIPDLLDAMLAAERSSRR